MVDDNAVLFHSVADALVRFRDAVSSENVNEQQAAMIAFAELFATRAATACPICAARSAAIFN